MGDFILRCGEKQALTSKVQSECEWTGKDALTMIYDSWLADFQY